MDNFKEQQGYYFPFGIIMIGWILSIFGLYVIFSKPVLGILLSPVGPLLQFITYGIEIDLTERKFRDYHKIFGIEVGTWQPLQDIEYISVFRSQRSQGVSVGVARGETNFEKYTVNLVTSARERISVSENDDKSEAIRIAALISNRLQIEVLDSTQPEQKWLGIM